MKHDNEPDSWATAAQIRKTLKFVTLFRFGRLKPEHIKRMGNDEWNLAARMLNVSTPNEIHRTLIIQVLTDWLSLKTFRVNAAMARSVVGDIKKVTKSDKADKKAAQDLAKQLKMSLE
jgi:hypothetical protein